MAITDAYTAESIRVLTGLEAVRMRPGMYVGDTDSSAALHQLLWEVLGNALDEYVAGHARTITVAIDGHRITVEDDGRGIPAEAIEVVLTSLHAGTAKRPHRHLALDLHGIGVAVANALSSALEITVWRDGHEFVQRFAQGLPRAPFERVGGTSRRGTRIVFEPDFTILKRRPWDVAMIRERCRELAGIEPGLQITVDDNTYCYASLADYLRDGREVIEPLDASVIENDIGVRVAIAWHDGPSSIRTLINGSPSGGVHVAALHAAIGAVFARRFTKRLARANIERGMVVVLHVTLDNPRFANPTRDWLQNAEVGEAVRVVVERELARHFDEVPALLDSLLLSLEPKRAARAPVPARRSTARPRTRRRTPRARETRSS